MITEAVKRLHRTVAAMRAGKLIPAEDALPLADALDQALAGKTDLDVAVGLVAPSPHSPRATARRARLIELLSAHYDGAPSRRAKLMEADAVRYSTTVWPNVRDMDGPPEFHTGQPEEILFSLQSEAVAGAAKWPVSWRTITDILELRQPVRWNAGRGFAAK